MYYNKKAQIWIETVIYTLIAFVLIGLVLTFVNPKIQEIQVQTLIEQSIEMMNDIDSLIENIGIAGNSRIIELSIKKGDLYIDGEINKIYFKLDSKYQYSEIGADITYGNLVLNTVENDNLMTITLTRDYSPLYNITFGGADEIKILSKLSTPYKLTITNNGGDPTTLNFELN